MAKVTFISCLISRQSKSVCLWQEPAWNVNYIKNGVVCKPEKLKRVNKDAKIYLERLRTLHEVQFCFNHTQRIYHVTQNEAFLLFIKCATEFVLILCIVKSPAKKNREQLIKKKTISSQTKTMLLNISYVQKTHYALNAIRLYRQYSARNGNRKM